MLKRLYFFLSIFLIIGFVFAIGWFIRYRNSIPPTINEPGVIGESSSTLPEAPSRNSSSGATTSIKVTLPPQKPFGLVADQEVVSYYPYSDGSIIFIQPGGQIMKVVGTEGTVLSSLGISNLSYAAFSYDGKKIVATFGNPLNLQISVFDIDKKSWEPVFARPATPPIWSPNDYRLVFGTQDQEASTITLVDTQSSPAKTQNLITLNIQDMVLGWKGTETLLVGERPSAFSSSQLISLDIRSKALSVLLKDWSGLDFLWNTAVQEGVILQANKNSTGGKMVLVGSSGVIARQFSYNSIPSKKCFFEKPASKNSNATSSSDLLEQPSRLLICAIPKNTGRLTNAFLPDDYFQKELMTEDAIFEMDLETGGIRDISKMIGEGVDATMLKTTPEAVFFINRYNNKLYRLLRS